MTNVSPSYILIHKCTKLYIKVSVVQMQRAKDTRDTDKPGYL